MRVQRPVEDLLAKHAPKAPSPAAADTTRVGSADHLALEGSPRDARSFSSFLEDQGETNGCGTTSLAMLLSFWKDKTGRYTRTGIDMAIRHFDMFTSPQNIVDYARSQGFRAVARNGSSVDEIRAMVDQGVPVQVLYDPNADGSDKLLHYVVVTDYKTDEKGNLTDLVIADPAGGKVDTVPVDEFKKRWDDIKFMNYGTGVDNLMIPMLPKRNVPIRGRDGKVRMSDDIALPKATGLGWRVAVADVLADATNLASKVKEKAASAFRSVRRAFSNL